jgi:tRNA dimethylallyltransferase
LEEAKSVYSHKSLNSLNTVGYKELFSYFDGICDLETAVDKIKQHTRNYAKRQTTWFKNQDNWAKIRSLDDALEKIDDQINKN